MRLADEATERSVIGGLLSNPDHVSVLAELLTDDCFTDYRRIIYATLENLALSGATISTSIVLSELTRTGQITDGKEWTLCLRAAVTDPVLLKRYVQRLSDLAGFRLARSYVNGFLQVDPDGNDIHSSIGQLQKDLSSIETGRLQSIVPFGQTLTDYQAQLESEYKGLINETISTGFRALDDRTGGFMPGLLHLYAGRPGEGKSSLLVAFLRSLAKNAVPSAVFWLEDPASMLALRMLSAEGNIASMTLRNGKSVQDWGPVLETGERIRNWPIYVESMRNMTMRDICQRMRRLSREKGVKVFFIDHLGKVKTGVSDRQDIEIGNAASDYLDQAASLGACPVAFHQLSRKADDNEQQDSLSWLFNSDYLGQHARVVGYIKQYSREIKIRIIKSTYGEKGDTIVLGWDGKTMNIYDLQPPEGPKSDCA